VENSKPINARVLKRLVKTCLAAEPTADDGDLIEAVKGRCAQAHMAYNSTAITKALDAVRAMRAHQARRK
jgi:hypothetical protein